LVPLPVCGVNLRSRTHFLSKCKIVQRSATYNEAVLRTFTTACSLPSLIFASPCRLARTGAREVIDAFSSLFFCSPCRLARTSARKNINAFPSLVFFAGLLEQVQGMLHTELDSQVLGNCLAVMIEVCLLTYNGCFPASSIDRCS